MMRSPREQGLMTDLQRNPEVLMKCQTTEWILWAIAMVVFLVLAISGRTLSLGVAIAAVAVVWYVIVPAFSSGRQ